MFKRILFLFLSPVLPLLIFAQSQEILIQGTTPDLYVVHTVAPKENWYSVGRLFNISPKEIAPLNGKTLTTPLNIGEQLKVPLTAANFSQNEARASDEALVPVYHVVQDKEWMFRISTNYNKVPVENLEKWNNVGKDGAKPGTRLIVGYLKVKRDQSAIASQANAPGTSPTSNPAAGNTTGAGSNAKPGSVSMNSGTTNPVASNNSSAIMKPVTAPPVTTAPVAETKPASKPESSIAQPRATQPPVVETQQPVSVAPGDSYFKTLYESAGKSASGVAGIFKSVSGWQDKKYYALMNNVNVGTIIRVTNPATNKFVYAKVLGQLPEMKESNGLAVRISDAAAADLGATISRFNVQVAY